MSRPALPFILLLGLAACGQQEPATPPVTQVEPAPAVEAAAPVEPMAMPGPEAGTPAAAPTLELPKPAPAATPAPAPKASAPAPAKAAEAVAAPAVAATSGLDAAKAKYASLCANCHGKTGAGMGNSPKVAGQSADALATKLKQYRAGEKIGPASVSMFPFAKPLSDEDIAQLAAYMASL